MNNGIKINSVRLKILENLPIKINIPLIRPIRLQAFHGKQVCSQNLHAERSGQIQAKLAFGVIMALQMAYSANAKLPSRKSRRRSS